MKDSLVNNPAPGQNMEEGKNITNDPSQQAFPESSPRNTNVEHSVANGDTDKVSNVQNEDDKNKEIAS